MSEDIRVIHASVSECECMLSGLCRLFAAEVPEHVREVFRFYAHSADYVLLIAAIDTRVVGFLAGSSPMTFDFEGRVGRIDSLLVHREWRRRGVGACLTAEFTALARGRSCRHIVADVMVAEGREAAQRFYRSRGFRESGLRQYSRPISEEAG